jgi:hypothetical protein
MSPPFDRDQATVSASPRSSGRGGRPLEKPPGSVPAERAAPLLPRPAGPCSARPLDAGGPRQHAIDLVHRRLPAGADVDRAGGRHAGQRPHHRVGHVAHVDVVARLLAVSVDHARPPTQQSSREDRDDSGLAFRVLPWPVHVGQPQRHTAGAVQPAQQSELELGGDLGNAVGRGGPGSGASPASHDVGVAVAGAAPWKCRRRCGRWRFDRPRAGSACRGCAPTRRSRDRQPSGTPRPAPPDARPRPVAWRRRFEAARGARTSATCSRAPGLTFVRAPGAEVVHDRHLVAVRDQPIDGQCEPMKPAPPVTMILRVVVLSGCR